MGLLEPLGQSQVLGYLRVLSRGHRITVVSFEKPAELADTAAVAALRAECEAHGITWRPRRYHHRPRLLATGWDLLVYTCTAIVEYRRIRADVIHARGYISSTVASMIKMMFGVPFIFDMRAFWPDEMIVAGRLRRGSLVHRLLMWAEKWCLRQSLAVVSLTEAGVEHMHRVYGPAARDVRFAVVPTCVDLAKFRPAPQPARELIVVGSVGSVLTGWFRLDWLMSFFRALSVAEPSVQVRIVTREDENALRRRAAEAGIPADRLEVFGVPSSGVPQAVAGFSAAAMFFETGIAKLGSCPTRMGEILAAGLPVVANPGVGDVGEIIERYRVGVLVTENTDESMRSAVAALKALLNDPDLSARCRRAAEDWFSLEKGAARYDELYALAKRGR